MAVIFQACETNSRGLDLIPAPLEQITRFSLFISTSLSHFLASSDFPMNPGSAGPLCGSDNDPLGVVMLGLESSY